MVKRTPKGRQLSSPAGKSGKKKSSGSARKPDHSSHSGHRNEPKRQGKGFGHRNHEDNAGNDRHAHRGAHRNDREERATAPLPEGEVIYGKHSVKAVLLKRPESVHALVLAGKEEYHADLVQLAAQSQIPLHRLGWPEFNAQGAFKEDEKHQGVFVRTTPRTIYDEGDLPRLADVRCLLVLDQVSNPQNLATIIRSAAFFEADALLYMKNRAATPTAEVVRFAVGGAEMIDMYQVTNISQCLDTLKEFGFAVLGLDERGQKTLAQHDLSGKVAFVIGAEGEGLRKKTKQYCSDLVRIPGGAEGIESLNAAVATTIALYEFARLKTDT